MISLTEKNFKHLQQLNFQKQKKLIKAISFFIDRFQIFEEKYNHSNFIKSHD